MNDVHGALSYNRMLFDCICGNNDCRTCPNELTLPTPEYKGIIELKLFPHTAMQTAYTCFLTDEILNDNLMAWGMICPIFLRQEKQYVFTVWFGPAVDGAFIYTDENYIITKFEINGKYKNPVVNNRWLPAMNKYKGYKFIFPDEKEYPCYE